MTNHQTKICKICGIEKKLTSYYAKKTCHLGCLPTCKHCFNNARSNPIITKHIATISIKGEVWKDIEGFEGLYQVSDFGRIKSVFKKIKSGNGGKRFIQEGILKINVSKQYFYANLYCEGHRKPYLLHRLVAIAFIANPQNNKYVNHIDGNKLNNIPSNLEWCTSSENNYHAIRNGLRRVVKGVNHYSCKKIKDLLTGKVYPSVTEAAISTGFKIGTIYYQARFAKKELRFLMVN